MTPASAGRASRLRDLARRIGRLSPHWTNPDRFFAERSEIEHELTRVAREMEV